jgi:hypothetical protein
MTDLANPLSPSWRRFLRFSVRGMIVLVLVVGGWLGWIVRKAHVQRQAVWAIERAGGEVFYDWQFSNGEFDVEGKTWASRYLVDFFGVDYFGHVIAVDLVSSSAPTDEALAAVGRLSHLQNFGFYGAAPSNAGLRHLKGLTKLTSLDFSGSHLSDVGLAHLRGLTALTYLDLGGSHITDAGLIHLNGLLKLSALGLGETKVTDSGLAHLQGMTELLDLELDDTQVTDAGLVHLKSMKRLVRLAIHNTQVTDAGVKELQQALPNLTITR